MKKIISLFFTFLYGVFSSNAQSVPTHKMYVDFGVTNTDDIVSMLDQWSPGSNFSRNPSYVDENFFISRVPLKKRFASPATQANPKLNAENGKNLCWCVPIGEMTGKWGPLPRWTFDGDNFNMWQYVKVHANWSNGWWRVPGAFNDVAHKNGVTTGCLYFINWGEEVNAASDAGRMLAQLCEKDKDGHFKYARKLISFLRYYGIDGLGVNPEGTWSQQLTDDFTSFLAECHKAAQEMDFPFHVEWYSVVTNDGKLDDDDCALEVGVNDYWFQKDGEKVTDVFFLNYNWTGTSLQKSVEAARALGRNTFDLYAGFDQEGQGYGTSYFNGGWEALMEQPVSIIVWGGHACSQLYADSHEGGYGDLAVQNEYQKKQEMLFTGGSRNVLQTPEVRNVQYTPTYNSLTDWHGYSKAVIEQSALSELPFVTRFSLGNGQWLKKQGQTTFNHNWYNIGMQDMLPTWRWWIDNGDGRTVPADPVQVDFTFDDAWTGGSCLKLHGATQRSHVRLFSTRWGVGNSADVLSLTYKVNHGTDPHLQLSLSCLGAENTRHTVAVPLETDKTGEWQTVHFHPSDFGLAPGDTIASLGLEVDHTDSSYETLIGEMSYVPESFHEDPVEPTITYAEMLQRKDDKADVKVVFDVPFAGTRKAAYKDCPIYNEEVGAWYYEIYVKRGDAEPQLVATTTSWASYVVDVPMLGAESLQIGVCAVGRDGQTASPIAWSKPLTHSATYSGQVKTDKPLVKPNEDFTIGFENPQHPAADFEVIRAETDQVVAHVEDKTSFTMCLPDTGIYDVKVILPDTVEMNRALVLVSPESTGRLPKVGTIRADHMQVDNPNQIVHFETTADDGTTYFKTNGEKAPCMVSKALYLADPYQFTVDSEVMEEYEHTSYALWFKPERFVHGPLGTVLMKKVNHNYPGTWTEKEWGEMWTAIRPEGFGLNLAHGEKVANGANELSVNVDAPESGTEGYDHQNDVDGLTKGYSLLPGQWYHCCVVKDGKNVKLYLNGKCVIDATSRGADPKYWMGANFYVGGQMKNMAGFTGWIDEVQVWSKALSQAEVAQAMKGFDRAPEGLEGYFKFETQQTDEEGNVFVPNEGCAKEAVPGGYLTYRERLYDTTYDENSNTFTMGTGVPLLQGTLPIELKSSKWTLDGAQVVQSFPTAAEATYPAAGTYGASLTLVNTWGEQCAQMADSIEVLFPSGWNETALEENRTSICIRPLEAMVYAHFAAGGRYSLVVYDNNGRLMKRHAYEVATGGSSATFSLQGLSGPYVVCIQKDGQNLQTLKTVLP